MMERSFANRDFFALVEQTIGEGRSITIPVNGVSMHPFIRSGRDKAVLSPFDASDLRVGAIVLFRYRGTHVMHRIVSREGGRLTMQGDGNNVSTIETADIGDVVALVRYVIKPSGRVVDCMSEAQMRRFRMWRLLNPVRRYIMALDRRMPHRR